MTWHFRDLLLTQRAIPHIDACHFSDEGMTFHKLFPCFFIQFSVHHFAFCRYRSSCVKEISKFLELILGLDLELHVCPCKNRAKSTIRGKAQKIKFAPLLHTVINFSSGDQEEVENIDIIATIRTDHSAITLHFLWRFSSLSHLCTCSIGYFPLLGSSGSTRWSEWSRWYVHHYWNN